MSSTSSAGFPEGTRVVTSRGQRGTVAAVEQPRTGHDMVRAAAEYPARVYWVTLDSGARVICGDNDLEAL